ncbi:hypothetical protein RND81_09G031500 [Saponaria officinalis]|uniref:26S proteasome regulatory subunit 7-like OB domain-containing protein n=1 Tax=Saponaria officinalis TaxID=3572 RepID=A0AAW1IGZ2_SAPOF
MTCVVCFVVGLGDKVSPTDIEEGMRIGVDRTKYQIQIPLPPKIDPSVTMMTVEEKPDVTYNDIGGWKEQIENMREVSVSDFLYKTFYSLYIMLKLTLYIFILYIFGT